MLGGMSSLDSNPAGFQLDGVPSVFARVVVDDSGSRVFDYSVPKGVVVQVGARVRVPVRTRNVLGTVLELSNSTEVSGVRPIASVMSGEPALNPALLKLAAWMADYYCCPLEAAIRSVLPQVIRKSEMTHQERQVVRLIQLPSEEVRLALQSRAPLQAAALAALEQAGTPLPVTELTKLSDATHAVVRALERKGWVAVETIIDEHIVRELIPALKAAGAEGVTEYPLNKVVY